MKLNARFGISLSLAALLGLGLSTGCQPAGTDQASTANTASDHDGHDHDGHDHDGHDHDGHDHDHGDVINAADAGLSTDDLVMVDASPRPETLAEAIEELADLRKTIAKGFADDDVDSIHDQLHEIGNLLEATSDLVAESDLPDASKKTAGESIEALFEAYGGVDAKLHGETGTEYDEVSKTIDEAVQALQELP